MPTTIHGFAEFERIFGGLWYNSTMSYAVWHYFLNGGSTAIIIRIPTTYTTYGKTLMRCPDTSHAFYIEAKYPGQWINNFIIQPTYVNIDPASTTDFNLLVLRYDGPVLGGSPPRNIIEREAHYNVSVVPGTPRFIGDILERDSEFVRVSSAFLNNMPAARPIQAPMNFDFSTGEDSGVLNDALYLGDSTLKTGLYALDLVDRFDLLCIPPMKRGTTGGAGYDISNAIWQAALAYCKKRRAMLIVDPPAQWDTVSEVTSGIDATGLRDENAVFFFPRVLATDPLTNGIQDQFVPSGAVAGVIARTDAERGRWKAPAGADARLIGVSGFAARLTDAETGSLNPLGINVLKAMPGAGNVVWGARTMRGDDRLASDWKYLPVRRTALFIEESLYGGTQWAVFEPNDESLWGQIRLNVGAFMHQLFRQGAFQGAKPSEAYFVKCDRETTTQDDINQGVVNIVVGFAPLKPAEFVVIKLQQMAGQIAA